MSHGSDWRQEGVSKKAGEEKEEPFWLEYTEGELDESLEQDIDLLLSRSKGGKKCVSEYESLKKVLKETDEDLLPEDGRYYKNLHDRIMSEVQECARIEEESREKSSSLPTFLMGGGLLALLVAVLYQVPGVKNSWNWPAVKEIGEKVGENKVALNDWLLRASLERPTVYTDSMLSFENENDLVQEAARNELNKLSDQELQEILNNVMKSQ